MIEYFGLLPPNRSDLLRAGEDPIQREVCLCPEGNVRYDGTNFGAHFDGQRRVSLSVAVKHNKRDEHLIWVWGTGLLVHDSLIAEFESLRLTGYRLKPASVRFRDGRLSREYRELAVIGWAGIAPRNPGFTSSNGAAVATTRHIAA